MNHFQLQSKSAVSFVPRTLFPGTTLKAASFCFFARKKLKRILKCFSISPFLLHPMRARTKYITCTWHGNFIFQEQFWLHFDIALRLTRQSLSYLLNKSLKYFQTLFMRPDQMASLLRFNLFHLTPIYKELFRHFY